MMAHFKTFSRSIIGAIAITLSAVAAEAQNAKTIMEKADANARRQSDSSFMVMQISTCKYGVKGGKIKCVSKPTVKKLESASINAGRGGKDTKSISIILEPASERGIGMLSYAYDDSKKDNETWLYLSALGKVKRMVASNSDANSEPVNIFGSEFTTEDQETGKIDDYTYKLLETVKFQGRKTYVIEQTPTPARAKKTRYAKTVVWIDAQRYLALKVAMYDKRGNEIRRILAGKIEKINGIWLSRSITIMNLVSTRLSNMALGSITFGVDIDEELLTKRSLTDKAFRERQLKALRAQAR